MEALEIHLEQGKNHPSVAVLLILRAPIPIKLFVPHPWASGDPAQDLPLDSGKEQCDIQLMKLMASWRMLYYLYLMEFKLSEAFTVAGT